MKSLRDNALRTSTHHETAEPESDIDAIHGVIQSLPHRDREAIVLCTLEGKTLSQAAELIGVKRNTLEVRLHRARNRLKKLLLQETES